MSRIVSVLLSVLLLVVCQNAGAQQRKATTAKASATNVTQKKLFLPQAYLGNSDYKGGAIKRDELSKLLRQGLTSRDSLGNRYKVTGFEFSYAERMLYEDSISNVMVLVDYMTEYCPGDTLTGGISSSIYDRIKAGDTVYFERISVLRDNSNTGGDVIAGKGMKFVITK